MDKSGPYATIYSACQRGSLAMVTIALTALALYATGALVAFPLVWLKEAKERKLYPANPHLGFFGLVGASLLWLPLLCVEIFDRKELKEGLG